MTARPTRAPTEEIARKAGASFVGPARQPGALVGPQRRTGRGHHALGGLRRLRLSCRPTAGCRRCWATSTTLWWPPWRPASCPPPRPADGARPLPGDPFVARHGSGRRAGAALEPDPLRPERRPRGAPGRWPGSGSSIPICAAERTSISSGGCTPPDGMSATSRVHGRPPGSDDGGAVAGPAGLLRHHGRAPGPRHPRSVAPVTTSAWSAAVWGLACVRRPVAGPGHPGRPRFSSWPAASRELVEAPVTSGGPDRRRGYGPVDAAGLNGLTRAWAPALVLGLLVAPDPPGGGPGSAGPGRPTSGGRTDRRRPRSRPLQPCSARGRRRRLRRRGVGRVV